MRGLNRLEAPLGNSVYTQVDQAELEAHDGVTAGKYTIGLGQASPEPGCLDMSVRCTISLCPKCSWREHALQQTSLRYVPLLAMYVVRLGCWTAAEVYGLLQ